MPDPKTIHRIHTELNYSEEIVVAWFKHQMSLQSLFEEKPEEKGPLESILIKQRLSRIRKIKKTKKPYQHLLTKFKIPDTKYWDAELCYELLTTDSVDHFIDLKALEDSLK